MKIRKKIIGVLLGIAFIFSYNSAEVANAVDVAASSARSSDEFKKAYNTGKSKGIITDENMSYKDFVSLCKSSVFPAYLNAVKEDSTLTFQSFIAQDNYEVSPEDSGITSSALLRATGSSSYNMQAGDILVVWGSNSLDKARYVGHAAIASSSKYIMEMPGKKISKHATHTRKATFFKRHTGDPKYVEVYRMKNHPKYAKKAATYAYRHMYLKDNPSYMITSNLYHKSPSYCSKYVYLAYWWGATKSALKKYKNGGQYIVTPHGLTDNFVGSFKPIRIHKISTY